MGEAKAKNEAVEAAVEQLKGSAGKPVELKLDQACVMTAYARMQSALQNEAHFLGQIGQREACGELLSAAEHLAKFSTRFLAEAQRSIIIPKAPVLQGLNP